MIDLGVPLVLPIPKRASQVPLTGSAVCLNQAQQDRDRPGVQNHHRLHHVRRQVKRLQQLLCRLLGDFWLAGCALLVWAVMQALGWWLF
jgi:hypothetical protein